MLQRKNKTSSTDWNRGYLVAGAQLGAHGDLVLSCISEERSPEELQVYGARRIRAARESLGPVVSRPPRSRGGRAIPRRWGVMEAEQVRTTEDWRRAANPRRWNLQCSPWCRKDTGW